MASVGSFSDDDFFDNPPRGLIYGAFCVVIVIQYLYLFTFNWVPELRAPLSGTIAAFNVILAAITVLVRPAPWIYLLLGSAGLTILTLIPAHALGFGEAPVFDAAEAIRKLVLPLIMIWVLTFPLALPRSLLWWVAVLGSIVGVVIAFSGPPVYLGGGFDDPRLASITGGLNQMHPSTKFIALQLVLVDVLRRGGLMTPKVAWPLTALCAAALIGYRGRTEILFIFIYYLSLVYSHFRKITIVKWSPPIIFTLVVTVSIIALYVGENVQYWGSGRIGTWYERLVLVVNRDIVTFLFGGGIGSDRVWTSQWAFADEGLIAHNDYLYFLMEHGLFGLFIPVMFLWGLWLRTHSYGHAIVAAVAVSSFFDNGFFRSPLLSTCLALVLAASIVANLAREHAD